MAYIQERLYEDGFERHAKYIQGCVRIKLDVKRSAYLLDLEPGRGMLKTRLGSNHQLPDTYVFE